MIDILVGLRGARRPAVHSRRRRRRRACRPCRQRFPQDLRHRGLCPDRQRLRADGAHQRRRLVDRFRQLAARQPTSGPRTCVLVFSVGGGNAEKNISANIVEALKLAKSVGARIIGVVGRDGGYTAGRRRLRGGADRQSRNGDATHRGFSGGSLARHRQPSQAACRTR